MKCAIHIYGPDIVTIKGKTVRKSPREIYNGKKIPLPKTIRDHHANIHISADYLFIQGVPILHTISQSYRFRTVEALISKNKAKKEDTLKGINTVINMYKGRNL